MRARVLPKILSIKVEQYLERNDVIVMPVSAIEPHSGFLLDSETVISEAFALKAAEVADGLVLTGLPYFYAGTVAIIRGATQVSVREGVDYLGAIARSLLGQGSEHQVYISFHDPACTACSPMVRDSFNETGVPILYMDLAMQIMKETKDLSKSLDAFHAITMTVYDVMGQLGDIPLTTKYFHQEPQTVEQLNGLLELACQSGSIGYCFGDRKNHMSTTAVPTEERHRELAKRRGSVIEGVINRTHMKRVVADMWDSEKFQMEAMEKYLWMPAAYSRGKQGPDA